MKLVNDIKVTESISSMDRPTPSILTENQRADHLWLHAPFSIEIWSKIFLMISSLWKLDKNRDWTQPEASHIFFLLFSVIYFVSYNIHISNYQLIKHKQRLIRDVKNN